MAGRLIFVTYAAGAYARNLAPNGRFARHGLGADQVLLHTRQDLERDPLYAAHRDVFDAARGAGYWAWKPLFILRALEQAQPGDVVLYQDCGTGLRYKNVLRPRELLAMARARGMIAGVRTPQYGANRRWNRKACLASMGVDRPDWLEAATIEASVSLWPASAESREFVAAWLDWCLTLEAIRDARPDELAGEDPAFVEHRFDQSILTNLCLTRAAPVLEVNEATLPLAKSVTMLELDLRARRSGAWRLLYRAVTGLGAWRRTRR